MLIKREMDYAIRIVRALSRQEQLSAASIAAQEGMQQAVTYKVLKKLVKAGIVISHRGVEGGYQLKGTCAQITFYDLFHAIGEDLLLTECLEPDYQCGNNRNGCCGAHREFCRIQRVLEREMRRTSLQEILK